MIELFKSLAAFQQEVPSIHQGASGYNYTYADLNAIFEVINPLLKKHKLGFTQLVNRDVLETIVFHCESGDVITSETTLLNGVTLNKMNDFQVLGSQITYLRRYALSSLLGLVTDADNDGVGDQDKTKKKKEEEVKTTWLTKDQFDKAMLADAKGITATLNAFGKPGYAMKSEYRINLTTQLKTVK